MKILYIGNERRHAQTVARLLRGISESVPLAWTHSLDQGARYFAQNRDLAVLVIDAQIHAGQWPSSLKDLRSLPHRPAIVTVVPEGTPPFDPLVPIPDESVVNSATFPTDLPSAVSRAIARVRGTQVPPARSDEQTHSPVRLTPEQAVDALLDLKPTSHADVEQNVASVTAALQQAERRHAAAMTAAQTAHELAAIEQLTEQERQFQAQLALEREKRRTLEEKLSAATSAREEAERRYALALTDAAAQSRGLEERIGQREAELAAQSQRERALQSTLEQKIANADARMRDLQQRHDAAVSRAAGELAEQRAHFDRELSRTALEGNQLRERLLEAELSRDEARHDRESRAADITRLTRREADLSAQLAKVEGERHMVAARLTDAVREIEEARESAARERAAAEHTLTLALARENDARETLERQLAEIRSAAADVERGLRDEAAALRAQAVAREAFFDARLADERLEFDERLADVRSERDRFEQACTAANADVQRLTGDLSDARRVIEDTRRELQDANDRQSAEYASLFAAFAVSLVERDERVKEEAARHDAALQASERARAELHECLQATLAAGRHDIDQVQHALMATLEALRTTKRRQDVRQNEADRIAESHEPTHESQAATVRTAQQPDIAAWQQLSKDASLV
jgi:chromosome segregation ATPase